MVRVLRANAWLIALLVIFGAAIGYAINTWLAANRPRYTSTGMIRIMTPRISRTWVRFQEGAMLRTLILRAMSRRPKYSTVI